MIRHLLVIGGQRCGTTSVARMLEAHPEIAMARPAKPEPKVFCDEAASAKGATWYRSTYFPHAEPGQLLCDKSTSYLEDPAAPARAAAVLGQAEVVVVLRDPVQRAVSNWRFSTRHGLETRPLDVALSENLAGPAPWDPTRTSVSPFAYLERGRYLEHLEPWLATFPETTHVLFLDELADRPGTVPALWAALGLDPAAGPQRLERAVNGSAGPMPALHDGLRGKVQAYFESSDRALSARLGRALPW